MKNPIKYFTMVLSTIIFGACAKVNFDKVANCNNSGLVCQKSCEGSNCFENFDQSYTATKPAVDILFVVDNSGSMSSQQKEMGSKFPTLFEKIKDLDYQIAITTTDVEESRNAFNSTPSFKMPLSAINGPNGYFRDGRFVQFKTVLQENGSFRTVFGSGENNAILTPTTPNKQELFLNTVSREETALCDQNGYQQNYCPSGDERAIFALNKAYEKQKSFFRPNAHLAVIILSDEDERSKTKFLNGEIVADNDAALKYFNILSEMDKPETFKWAYMRDHPNKTVTAYPIIVQPGDVDCFNKQKESNTSGQYGNMYDHFSQITGGKSGSICSTDYSKELGTIAGSINEQVKSVSIACTPYQDKIEITFDPNTQVTVKKDLVEKKIYFEPALPPGTTVHIRYRCAL